MMNENGKKREEMMEDFEALIEESLQQPQRGSIVKATVAQISDDEVLFNIGYKTEGAAPRSEFDDNLKVDDIIDMAVVSFAGGGYVQLSRKSINERSDWDSIKTASTDEVPVQVKIVSHVEKGYVGKIGEIDAFIPDNHIDIHLKNADPKSYIGRTMPAKVLKFGGKKRSALVSPRLYLIEEAQKEKQEFFSKINVGDKLKGRVKTIKDYGVFVNFGAVDGFLHRNEISWGRVKNPTKYLELNDEVEVVVLDVKKDTNQIAVGMKQLTPDPWDNAIKKYPLGSSIKGAVITRKRAGYVIEIEPGIDGFVPNEELSWLKNAKTSLNVKDVVEGRVVDYDNERKRVVMSVKALNDNPWKSIREENPEGGVVKGKIKNITDFGLFVDFGSLIDGLVRKSDIAWVDEPADLNTLYKVGEEIEAKILKIDEERERISLGVKQLTNNPFKEISRILPAGKVDSFKITNVTKTGLEVELPLGMKGFIAQNELAADAQAMDKYTAGDMITAIVMKPDFRDNKDSKQINLSVKKYLTDSERRETRDYMKKIADSDNSFSFGSIFKDKLGK